jgi:hypothetical protein
MIVFLRESIVDSHFVFLTFIAICMPIFNRSRMKRTVNPLIALIAMFSEGVRTVVPLSAKSKPFFECFWSIAETVSANYKKQAIL